MASETPQRRRAAATRPAPGVSPRSSGHWLRLAVLALAAVLTYANALSNPFVFDDLGAIVSNTSIDDLGDLARIANPPAESPLAGRPLGNLTFALSRAATGLDPMGFRIVNLALHIMCAWLVFGLARRTLERHAAAEPRMPAADVAFAAALLWVVHPLASEVVAYATQRTEGLFAVLALSTLYASLRAHDSTRRAVWQVTAIVACAAGMACKETMVVVPLLVVLFDRAFVFDGFAHAVRERGRFYAGLAAAWLVLVALQLAHPRTFSTGFASAAVSPWVYLLNQPAVILHYLRLVVWPVGLVANYGWAVRLSLTDAWLPGLAVVGLLAATAVALVRWPRAGVLAASVFLVLAPTSSVVPIASEVGAERRMYLPLAAIVVLAVTGAVRACHKQRTDERPSGGRSGVAWVPFVAWLATAGGLATLTWQRNQEYSSALRLATTVVDRWPTPVAHHLVGSYLAEAGRFDEAVVHLRAAAPGNPPARYNLGAELFREGKHEEAIAELQAFIAAEPGLPAVRSARLLLTRAFMAQNRWSAAREALAAIQPGDDEVEALLADTLAAEQRFADAIPHYRIVVAAAPANAGAWTGLGVALASVRQLDEAVAAFRRAADLEPGNPAYAMNLVKVLLGSGQADAAALAIQRLVDARPSDPAAHELFGRILAATGRVDDARREFERALALDPANASAAEDLRHLPPRG